MDAISKVLWDAKDGSHINRAAAIWQCRSCNMSCHDKTSVCVHVHASAYINMHNIILNN